MGDRGQTGLQQLSHPPMLFDQLIEAPRLSIKEVGDRALLVQGRKGKRHSFQILTADRAVERRDSTGQETVLIESDLGPHSNGAETCHRSFAAARTRGRRD